MLFEAMISADELVNMISHQGFHFDSPNLQDSVNMALSWMVLHLGHIFMLVWDMISARWAH